MATISLTVPDAKVPDIQAAVAAYNAEHGTALTVPQWIKRVVAREVYGPQITDARTNAFLQKEAEAQAAAEAAESTLLASL